MKAARFLAIAAGYIISLSAYAQAVTKEEVARWEQQAKGVTITRDTWGIPHILGKTDADAVFGMLYAQCEDDFNRVERNYIVATARLAETEGEEKLYNDLRMRLFYDTAMAISIFKTSPEWMKKLCNGFADGINYYLYKHPEVKPKLIRRFQPWMPLLFSEGSIGGDIEDVDLGYIKEFYGHLAGAKPPRDVGDGPEPEPRGSNGFAIAPARSASGNALLMINPHTTFYFRSELHVASEEGLNAYGATTWGQFFIYQGFNEHCGWMHTSSAADVIDFYSENVSKKGEGFVYAYGKEQRRVSEEKITLRFKKDGGYGKKEFTVYRTHHGPVVGAVDGKWVSVKLMVEPLNALTQSFERTKSKGLDDFRKSMILRTNSSNNTVYADDKGNIAYWHGDFLPKRDPKYNWSETVDGSNPGTEWQGLHSIDEIVHVVNPASGWIQNCNSTPFTVSGPSSPQKNAYPTYMAPDAENTRGLHAVRVFSNAQALTIDKLIASAYDSYLTAFEILMPPLLRAFDEEAAKSDTTRAIYQDAIKVLRDWDLRFSESSIPTTLAIYWAQRLGDDVRKNTPPNLDQLARIEFLAKAPSKDMVKALAGTIASLKRDFGTWQVAWGDVNRFQRLTDDIDPKFDDQRPSVAVPFTSAYWGSLASFGAHTYAGTKKMYGNVGNSFVAAVEFGSKVKAKSIVTGGSSGNVNSGHFNDQGPLYAKGKFKDVWFYKADYDAHAEKTYHPGE